MNCDYVRQYYGVPAEIGRRVRAYGELGTIAQDRGHYIGINLDKDKPGRVNNYHPVDGIEYLEEVVAPRKMTRAQERYRQWQRADDSSTFREWLGIYPRWARSRAK